VNVTPADIAKSRGVAWSTAWRWFVRVQKAEPHVVHRLGRTLVADANKLARWIPPPKRKLVGKEEHDKILAQVGDFQRRLDVEVRERLALRDSLRKVQRDLDDIRRTLSFPVVR
jgi:hypothetical protein